MFSERKEIASASNSYGIIFRQFDGLSRFLVGQVDVKAIDLDRLKSGNLDVEVKVDRKLSEFKAQQGIVPVAYHRELIIRNGQYAAVQSVRASPFRALRPSKIFRFKLLRDAIGLVGMNQSQPQSH